MTLSITDAEIKYADDFEFLDGKDPLRGAVIANGGDGKAKVTVFEWDPAAKRLRRKDILHKATITDSKDGGYTITGHSLRAENLVAAGGAPFDPADAQVEIHVKPGPGCKGCGK